MKWTQRCDVDAPPVVIDMVHDKVYAARMAHATTVCHLVKAVVRQITTLASVAHSKSSLSALDIMPSVGLRQYARDAIPDALTTTACSGLRACNAKPHATMAADVLTKSFMLSQVHGLSPSSRPALARTFR